MNVSQLHGWLGQILDAGVSPKLPVVCICDGWPCEIAGAEMLEGKFRGDPAPSLIAYRPGSGTMLALVPIGEGVGDLLAPSVAGTPASHSVREMQVEFPVVD